MAAAADGAFRKVTAELDVRIAQLPLPCSTPSDSVAQRLRDATQIVGDMAASLTRGINGVADKVPQRRPESLTVLPGAPAQLAPVPVFWDVAALRDMTKDHPNRELVEYVCGEITRGADIYMELQEGLSFEDISHVVGVDAPPPIRDNIVLHNATVRQLQKYLDAGTAIPVPHGTCVCVSTLSTLSQRVTAIFGLSMT
jgi:hypothetical protein